MYASPQNSTVIKDSISKCAEKMFKNKIVQNNDRHPLIESSDNLLRVYPVFAYLAWLGARDFISHHEPKGNVWKNRTRAFYIILYFSTSHEDFKRKKNNTSRLHTYV